MTGSILLVDDDSDTREALADGLRRRGYEVSTAESAAACLECLATKPVDLVVSDVWMPNVSGIELCGFIAAKYPNVMTIVLTADNSLDRVVEAIRAGAYDFLVKPVKLDLLTIAIDRGLEDIELREELQRLRSSGPDLTGSPIVGSCPDVQKMVELVKRIAPSDVTVLVTGESGTGKELVARALHEQSPRAAEPFVAINCAALPEALMESELFGHRRGAFTDARSDRAGLLERAGGGTVFLDEITEMSPALQAKLLRALQERTIRPVGADVEHRIACRIVAATNRDLEREVANRRFRSDLYYRINVVAVNVPALRTRGSDILTLAQYFLDRSSVRSGRPRKTLSEGVARLFLEHDWPGNVRELENTMEHALALSRTTAILIDDLPAKLRSVVVPTPPREVPEDVGHLAPLETFLRRYMQEVLSQVRGNKTRAARILGIDRRSLYRELNKTTSPSA